MVDPNRKINLNLPSDDDSDETETLSPSEIKLVKEFEEEFKNRFTDDDETFTVFCKQKQKPPPIVFPFDSFHHHNNRGSNRGGRFQPYGSRSGYDNRRHNDTQYRQHDRQDHNNQGHRYNNHYNRNRADYQQPPFKRAREDSYKPNSY